MSEQEKEAGLKAQAAEALVQELLGALKSLRSESRAVLGLERDGIVALVSETNVRCLERRIEEAEGAIAAAERRK